MIRWQRRWRRRQIAFFASENRCCAFCPEASLRHCHSRFAKFSRTCRKTKRSHSSVPATLVFRRRAIENNSKPYSWEDKTPLQQANRCQFFLPSVHEIETISCVEKQRPLKMRPGLQHVPTQICADLPYSPRARFR